MIHALLRTPAPAGRRLRRVATGGAVFGTVLLTALLPGAPAAFAAEAPVGLGTAAAYSVLGALAVTNTGPTTANGNVGLSPGPADVVGFPPGTTTGAIHNHDANAAQAQADLTTAYNDAAGRAPTASVGADLVGRTLVGGVYRATGPLGLTGTLTLDGQGDPNTVFIFQASSTLITGSASNVVLTNAAQGCNVFWQVGSSATLGTNSTFQGTIMALASVTVTTNTTVRGRALARTAAVTLDTDTFTTPTCDLNPPNIPTTTTVTASPNPVTAGRSVTLTAAVTTTAPVRTGSVQFTEGSKVLGTVALDSTGHAPLVVPTGSAGQTRRIIARYAGHLLLQPSVSRPTSLVVRAASTPTPTRSSSATATATPTTTPSTTGGVATSPVATGSTLAATGSRHVAGLSGAAAALVLVGCLLAWAGRGAVHRPRHRH